jgi:hypothetical protein
VAILGEGLGVDLGGDVAMLGVSDLGDLLVELLGDLDKATAVDLGKPLQVAKLGPQVEESAHDFLDLILVEGLDDVWDAAIAVLEDMEAAAGIGQLLVVKCVDILEVAV